MTNEMTTEIALHCMKTAICEEVCEECPMYGEVGTDHCEDDAHRMAIQALEEIQQYRAMERRLQNIYGECDGLLETVVQHLEKHENIKLPDNIIKAILLTDEEVDKWEQLKSIGTIEEFKALKEKNTPYKPKEYEDRYYACKCGNPLLHKWDEYPTKLMPKSRGYKYCLNCGQVIDWSE